MDTYACTECARCTNYCPAYNTGKNLSPMQLIHDIRYEMLDRVEIRDKIAGLEEQIGGLEEYSKSHGFDRRPDGAARTPRGDQGRERGDAEAHRWPRAGRHAVGVHHLRRVSGGLPGVHRASGEDHPDAPEPGARAGEDAAGAAAHVPQHRASEQSVGHRGRPAHGLGERAVGPDHRGEPRSRVHPVGRLCRRLR
jgi:hypothetical protein